MGMQVLEALSTEYPLEQARQAMKSPLESDETVQEVQ